jgi:hypothetical protein
MNRKKLWKIQVKDSPEIARIYEPGYFEDRFWYYKKEAKIALERLLRIVPECQATVVKDLK